MKIWTDGCNTFETEEEARENIYENMTWVDYEEYFYSNLSFHDFFERVRKIIDPEKFFLEFETEFCDAENEYFNNNYWEEEEEEEQRATAILYLYVNSIVRAIYLTKT